jgi:7-keto-8-aminopelargonate synthetase-like enzyme
LWIVQARVSQSESGDQSLKKICDLAERYDATVMVDDSHGVGFMGARGRGAHEYHDVMGRVDILSASTELRDPAFCQYAVVPERDD